MQKIKKNCTDRLTLYVLFDTFCYSMNYNYIYIIYIYIYNIIIICIL